MDFSGEGVHKLCCQRQSGSEGEGERQSRSGKSEWSRFNTKSFPGE